MTKHAITILKAGISIAIVAWLFNQAWKTDQFATLAHGEKKWGWLVLAFFVCFGAHLFAFVRWRTMVRALGLEFDFVDAIRIGLIGCFFNLFAFGVIGGDSLRAFYVCRRVKNRVPEAIASVIADRAIGLLTMFSVASLAFLALDFSTMDAVNPQKMRAVHLVLQIALVVTVVGFTGLAVVMFSPKITNFKWFKKLVRIPRIGPVFARLTQVFQAYSKKPGSILLAFAMSLGVNICFAITIYAIAVGLGGAHPTLADHFLIEPIAMVANAAPLPGGIGGMEIAIDFLYQSFSTVDNLAKNGIVVAFAFRFVLLFISSFGAIAWFTNRKQLSELKPRTVESTSTENQVVS